MGCRKVAANGVFPFLARQCWGWPRAATRLCSYGKKRKRGSCPSLIYPVPFPPSRGFKAHYPKLTGVVQVPESIFQRLF